MHYCHTILLKRILMLTHYKGDLLIIRKSRGEQGLVYARYSGEKSQTTGTYHLNHISLLAAVLFRSISLYD